MRIFDTNDPNWGRIALSHCSHKNKVKSYANVHGKIEFYDYCRDCKNEIDKSGDVVLSKEQLEKEPLESVVKYLNPDYDFDSVRATAEAIKHRKGGHITIIGTPSKDDLSDAQNADEEENNYLRLDDFEEF